MGATAQSVERQRIVTDLTAKIKMSHVVRHVHTWACSIPDCKEKLTGGSEDWAEEKGWAHEVLLGKEFDLCPFHVQQLKEFLFDVAF